MTEDRQPAPPEPKRPASAPPDAAGRWTSVAVVVIGILALVGYVDLKAQLSRIEGRQEATDVAAAPAQPVGPQAPAPPTAQAEAPPSPAQPTRWACDGTLSQAQVAEAIGRHGRSVFQCYEAYRQQAPDLAGTLQMHLRVNAAGGVDQVRFAGPLQAPDLLRCVREALPQWRFAAPTDGECAVVYAPFSLGEQQHPPGGR